MRIFLLEDDYSLNRVICSVLDSLNCQFDSFFDGEKAYDALNCIYDLYILDINVPSVDGLEILSKIKEFDNNKNVIIMSADNSIDTITEAYEKGCIDFIKKPFHLKELEFKIQNMQTNKIIYLDDNKYFDSSSMQFYINDTSIILSKKEQQLLAILVDNINQATTYEKIYHYVYDDIISDEALRSLIKRLRQKTSLNLNNLPGIGYKLEVISHK